MREGVPEYVRVDTVDSGFACPALHRLPDARGAQPTVSREPQPSELRMPMPRAKAQVAVDAARGLCADRQRTFAATLAEDVQDARLEVDIAAVVIVCGVPQIGDVGEAPAGVDQRAQDRRVTRCLEVAAVGRLQEPAQLVV